MRPHACGFARDTQRANRRGSTYVAVISVSVIVSIIGFAGIQIARVQSRSVEADNDARRAKLLARAAVEQAIAEMNQNSSWRTTYNSNVETSSITLGGGTMSFKLVDEDGNLADDTTDSVWIHGYGRVGNAAWVEKAYARIDGGKPLEFLRTAIHSRNMAFTSGTKTLTVVGAPVSTDGSLNLPDAGHTIAGDAEASSVTGSGSVSGTTTAPAAAKGMPVATIFDDYKNRATTLSHSGNFNNLVLSPATNQYDGAGTDPDGLYYLNTGGSNLSISALRLVGTLVIDVGAGTLTINSIVAEPHRSDFPVLIIKGNVTINQSAGTILETLTLTSLNPPGTPFEGSEDNDILDVFPNRILGLVHITGDLTATNLGSNFKGAMVVTGSVSLANSGRLTHDPNLMFNPPLGYTEDPASTKMVISSRSWSRTAAP